MKELHATGNVEEGVLKISHRRDFDAAVRALEYSGPFFATFTFGKGRSLGFNRYYFGMLKYLSEQLGDDVDVIHARNKLDFNPIISHLPDKSNGLIQETIVGGDTHNMTTTRFVEYVERCKQGWAERGYCVPDEYWLDKPEK